MSAGRALLLGSSLIDARFAESVATRKKHKRLMMGRHQQFIADGARVRHDLLLQVPGRLLLLSEACFDAALGGALRLVIGGAAAVALFLAHPLLPLLLNPCADI